MEGNDIIIENVQFDWDSEDELTALPSENTDIVSEEPDKIQDKSDEEIIKLLKEEDTKVEYVNNEDSTVVDEGLYNYFKETGIIPDETSKEELITSFEENFPTFIDSKIKEAVADYPEPVKDLLKFVSDGGDFKTFVERYQNSSEPDFESLDINNENIQEAIIEYHLSKDFDEDYIEDHIENLKESGKLSSIASKYYNKYVQEQKHSKALLLKEQEDQNKKLIEERNEFRKKIKNTLENVKEVKSMPINNRKEALEILDYVTGNPLNRKGVPKVYEDLKEALKDPEKLIFIAKLLKDDFDLSQIERKVETSKVRKIKDKITEIPIISKNIIDYLN